MKKPPYYQINDVNTLIHSIIHTYHPEITEPQNPNQYFCMDIQKQRSKDKVQPHINEIQINDQTIIIPTTQIIQNVQPSSPLKKTFPPLPFSEENLKFIKKFNFQFSNLLDTEYVKLCTTLINNKHCYAKHKNDVGLISTPFGIRLKENIKLQTQRPTKITIYYRAKLNKLLTELEKHNIFKQIAPTPEEKQDIGTTFSNPLIIIPKGDN